MLVYRNARCRGVAQQLMAAKRNDVDVVYHAEKLTWPLVTMDGNSRSQPGGIFGHCAELNAVGIEVLTPQQAVSRVRFELKNTD